LRIAPFVIGQCLQRELDRPIEVAIAE